MTTTSAPRPINQKVYNYPPGPKVKPLIADTLDFGSNPLRFVTKMHQQYGKAATVHFIGGVTIVMFFTPNAVRYILAEHPRDFTSNVFNATLEPLLGKGLLTIDGDLHRQQRRLVQPAFHKRRIESYATIMTDHTNDLLATWKHGETRDMLHEMQTLTMRIVTKTLFDVDLTRDDEHLSKAFNDVILYPNGERLAWQKLVQLDSPLTPYGRYRRGIATLDSTIYRIIEERRASKKDSGDVMSMMLTAQDEDGAVMTDKQLRDETMTFFAAGHETTANAMTWTLFLLAKHPQRAAILRDELRRVLGGRVPTIDDLPHLIYTDMVLKESMRLFPPAWAIGRQAEQDFELEGYHLPAKTAVMFPQWVIQRSPTIWGDDALAFKPERFDPEHPQEVPQFAYYPFGGGPRMCIGMPFAQMEARLLLATIAQRFSPRLADGFRVVAEPHITLRPKYGMKMVIE